MTIKVDVSRHHIQSNYNCPFNLYNPYMDYIDSQYPSDFSKICSSNRYDAIFLLPPWKAIYRQDNERYESFEQAEELHQFLVNSYKKFNYSVIEVPHGTIEERITFILDKLKLLF